MKSTGRSPSPVITTFHGYLCLDVFGTNALMLVVSMWGEQLTQTAGHIKQP